MTPLVEALNQILSDAELAQGREFVALDRALGRVLAENVAAAVDVPPWRNSAMDGFAVHSEDAASMPATLRIAQRIAAGAVGSRLERGTAAQIFTGAPVPEGADAVIMQENTRRHGGQVECQSEVVAGDNIRPKGQDIARGAVLLRRGRRLQAQDLGVLASVGIAEVAVLSSLRVGMFSTGDELREPGQELASGQIYNSNRYTLIGMLQALGYEYRDFGVVADTLEATTQLLRRAAGECDLLISTGGVSVGEEDYVKAAVEALGELRLWKLAIKPGKPLAYGRVCGVPFFGLPGNPAAAFVTFGLVVKAYLFAMQGVDQPPCRSWRVAAGFDWDKPGFRQEYLRGSLHTDKDGVQIAQIFSNQSSGVLSVISRADCLVVMPVGASCKRGDLVEVITLKEWLF
jgi:molybdopterin molybdotransferase